VKKTITLNEREVEYELVRKKVKNINLRIRPDCSVGVSVNSAVSAENIDGFLLSKATVIITALDKYAEIIKYSSPSYSYTTGESFRYLGKELRLKVAEGKKNVTADGVYLYLTLPNTNDTEAKAKLIEKWFDNECRELFPVLIENTHNIFRKYDVKLPKLILRDMATRWGSCQTKRGIITLNKRLIETPRECIEYVIMHEFTHFIQPNHSRKFYDLLAVFMPDWKARKATLEKYMFYAM